MIKRLIASRLLWRSRILTVLYLGYKAIKFGYGLYTKKSPNKKAKNL